VTASFLSAASLTRRARRDCLDEHADVGDEKLLPRVAQERATVRAAFRAVVVASPETDGPGFSAVSAGKIRIVSLTSSPSAFRTLVVRYVIGLRVALET
jgi:hypothetical protein